MLQQLLGCLLLQVDERQEETLQKSYTSPNVLLDEPFPSQQVTQEAFLPA